MKTTTRSTGFIFIFFLGLEARVSVTTLVLYPLGSRVHLSCGSGPHSSCSSIVWKKKGWHDSVELIRNERVSAGEKRMSLGSDCSLQIQDFRNTDAGDYMCDNGATSTSAISLAFPNITQELGGDSTLVLQCFPADSRGIFNRNNCTGFNFKWINEAQSELQGPRYEITEVTCMSKLHVKLKKTDHKRKWTCQVSQEGVFTASTSHTTTLKDGVDEVYATEGGSVALPCIDNDVLTHGHRLEWSVGGKTLFSLSHHDGVTVTGHDPPGCRMNADSSLVVKSVSEQHAGLYTCAEFNNFTQILTHRAVLLHTLRVTEEISATPTQRNITLTCTLTCAETCDPEQYISWQGGQLVTAVPKARTIRSELLLPDVQSSDRVTCVALREQMEKASQEWVPLREGPPVAVIAGISFLIIILLLAIGVLLWWKRRKAGDQEASSDRIGMGHIYENHNP
ncbi:uncharacterized protein LOC114790498 isoform X2 [Denticeps clupeoides]|uniref:uncharacterized protein LOC114790498 isoform X2 n=1 Tax=Denticeps clupeoides TaxID=299321 RepID=UPI0010A35462|nr:uncharacterized protein LOC114790498 isoform X2 [Denticeps clupeoides]